MVYQRTYPGPRKGVTFQIVKVNIPGHRKCHFSNSQSQHKLSLTKYIYARDYQHLPNQIDILYVNKFYDESK
jgi:hypothetical protein